jgi:hypothetical protein
VLAYVARRETKKAHILHASCWLVRVEFCNPAAVADRKARYSSRGACADCHLLVISCSQLYCTICMHGSDAYTRKKRSNELSDEHTLRHVRCRCASVLGRLAGRPCISVAKAAAQERHIFR